MSAAVAVPSGRLTVEQYLAWAETQPDGRYELVDGVPVRMSPERNMHALVKGAVYRALRTAVRQAQLDFVVLPDGPTVVIHQHQSREPDVVVQPLATIDWDSVRAESPVILVEVTSPSTMRTDTGDKLLEYFSLSSVQHYLLVHPVHRTVVHHRRTGVQSIATEIVSSGEISLDPPGLIVAVADLFEDLPLTGAN